MHNIKHNKKSTQTMGARIRRLRLDNGLTQREVADRLHKSESAIRMWELDKSEPDIDTLKIISALFNVDMNYLSGTAPASIRIPVYGDTAAGVPILAVEDYTSDDPDDWEEITEQMSKSGKYIALRIKGDSMEPRMHTGDVVIVRLQPDISSGDVAIVRINGDSATCKKIRTTSEGIWLVPFNTKYEPVFYTPEQIQSLPVQIIGKVVELRAKF